MADFQTVVVETDLLICGGGMAACGAAVEASYWAKKHGLKVTVVDKAAMDRSGAVAMGLSAINQYVDLNSGNNTLKDYCDYVRNDLMGITREDLVASIARHVDNTVHLFEKWGLPIWKDENGDYVHEGRWQLMINGESYKVIVAEAAKNALADAGGEYFERVFITHPLMNGNKCVGAIGFSVRENKLYIFKAKATMGLMGGAVHVFKPRSTGEGFGRSWYPPFNSGASAFFTLYAGAEMTCQEVRFIPVRFKDAYGPVGAWFLLFKSVATNAYGDNYMQTNAAELEKWAPYGKVKPSPANIRNWLMMLDVMEGKSPIYMQTAEAIQRIADTAADEKEAKKKLKELEAEAWEDFLDMTISQAILWAATNVEPEKKPSEIMACDPYFIGSHSGASGAWVSGPEDLQTSRDEGRVLLGLHRHDHGGGLFAAGDASGASSHKFSSGSFTEARIAGKAAIAYILDHNEAPVMDDAEVQKLGRDPEAPGTFEQHKGATTDPDINPNYIRPRPVHVSAPEDHGRVRRWRVVPVQDQRQAPGEGTGAAGLPEGRLRQHRRRDPPRAHAGLGSGAPDVPGRGPRAVHPLPGGDPLARLLLPLRQAQYGQRELVGVLQLQVRQNTGEWEMIKRPVKYITQ
jgi:adenylylsulfate reductase, subunit A